MFARHQQGFERAGRELRFAGADFRCRQPPDVVDAICARLSLDPIERGPLRLGPGDDHRPRFQERKIEAFADSEVLGISRLHAAEFDASGRRVEACVQDSAIGLAGT